MSDEEEKQALIDKEIRGVTARNLAWFNGGIATVLAAIIGSYFAIVTKIDKYNTNLNIVTNSINIISTKVDNNTLDIREIQQHTLPSLDNRMSIMEEKMKDKIFLKEAP